MKFHMPNLRSPGTRTLIALIFWAAVATVAITVNTRFPSRGHMSSGLTVPELIALIASLFIFSNIVAIATQWVLAFKRKPPAEAIMVGRIYTLVAVFAACISIAFGFGILASVGTALGAFAGLLLGWSLQAPVSGAAAWILISLKRPIRPGDRIQFPNLGLTGDVRDLGIMYTVLNQVGGAIGSEEAVGRDILVPNAMLFSQVVINYTALQEAPYMLDEVVLRITYDSNWETAEKTLVHAAKELTGDVIKATGVQPYIRSDLYDYGVYMRLRYMTRVKDRAETSYRISKRIFNDVQSAPDVDIAIPFVYSYRVATETREALGHALPAANPLAAAESALPNGNHQAGIQNIDIDSVEESNIPAEPEEVQKLADSISQHGLLQPVVVIARPDNGRYEVVAGHLRLEACKKLGWRTIPTVIVGAAQQAAAQCPRHQRVPAQPFIPAAPDPVPGPVLQPPPPPGQ